LPPKFLYDHNVEYGHVDEVSPLLRRVTARNPSHFTFKGSGTYVVGRGEVAVVDPGPDDKAHIDALAAALAGETITHILVTHTHSDHSPGCRLLKEFTDAPVYAFDPSVVTPPPEHWFDGFWEDFPEDEDSDNSTLDGSADAESARDQHADDEHEVPRETIEDDFVPDVVLNHGDLISGNGFTFEALHTPGHISNHLSFALSEEHGVFTGDHIMGWSTTVIPAPDGSLTEYMDSLQLLIDRPQDQVYWPTHGPPITAPQEFAMALRNHRNMRTEQVLACLGDGKHRVRDMVETMYADKPKKLFKPAALSVLSHLIHLVDTGQVVNDDSEAKPTGNWSLA